MKIFSNIDILRIFFATTSEGYFSLFILRLKKKTIKYKYFQESP